MALLKVTQSISSTVVPTVFIHGGPGANSGLFLGALLRHASIDFKKSIILHDQPGCGFDCKAPERYTFDVLCRHLKEDLNSFEDLHLLAESFGCTLALEFANRFPRKVRSLTLVGPHFDRELAQKNIIERASQVAAQLITSLKEKDFESAVLKRFFDARKEKLRFRKSSSKQRPVSKDLVLSSWSNEKVDRFEQELLGALDTMEVSDLLRDALLEVFKMDMMAFDFDSKKIEPLSTETLKGIAKKYDLFFVAPRTFSEVKACRDQALSLPASPYNEALLDRSNKRFTEELVAYTDWEEISRWPLVKKVLQNGKTVNVITGSSDPFATGESFIAQMKENSCFRPFKIEGAGHSPIYERPSETFSILETMIYGK